MVGVFDFPQSARRRAAGGLDVVVLVCTAHARMVDGACAVTMSWCALHEPVGRIISSSWPSDIQWWWC